MAHDRRHFSRQTVKPPVYVSLGPGRGSLLFDLSEGGLAVEVHGVPLSGQIVPVVFDLPETQSCIETICHVAWRDRLGARAGLEFLDLTETLQQQIKEWLSRRLPLAKRQDMSTRPEISETKQPGSRFTPRGAKNQVASAEEVGLISVEQRRRAATSADAYAFRPRSAVIQPRRTSEVWLREQKAVVGKAGRGEKRWEMVLEARRVPWWFAGAVLFLGLLFIVGYVLGRGQHHPETRVATPVGKDAARSAEASSPPAKAESAFPGLEMSFEAPPSPRGTVVLEVAAVPRESEAMAVVEALRKKNFPAILLMPDPDRYYRVQVGPFADTRSATIAMRKLEKEGFKPTIRRPGLDGERVSDQEPRP